MRAWTGQFGLRLLFQFRGPEVSHVNLGEVEGCRKDKGEAQGLWASGGGKWERGARWCVQKALLVLSCPGMSSHLEWGHLCALLCRSSALGPRLVPHAPIIIVPLLSHLHDFSSWPCVKMDSLFKDQFQYSLLQDTSVPPRFSENVLWTFTRVLVYFLFNVM